MLLEFNNIIKIHCSQYLVQFVVFILSSMENLAQIKTGNRNLYLRLDSLHSSLRDSPNPDSDSIQELYPRVIDALVSHKSAILQILSLESQKKRKNLELESTSHKKLKKLDLQSGDSVIVKHEKVWILAIVGKYLPNLQKYSIIDAEDSKEYISDPIDIIKLSPEPIEFTIGSQVLALFPGSSCFYNATVSKIEPLNYILLFEDDHGLERRVEKKFVLNQS